jgi:hypothetical protein
MEVSFGDSRFSVHTILLVECGQDKIWKKFANSAKNMELPFVLTKFGAILFSMPTPSTHRSVQFLPITPLQSWDPQRLLAWQVRTSIHHKRINGFFAALNVAYAIIPNPKLRAAFQNAYLRMGFFFGNSFSEIALEASYNHGREWLEKMKEYVRQNVDLVASFCEERLGGKIKVIKPQASYLVWLDCRGLQISQKELKDLFMNKMKLWASSGDTFGASGNGFMRLNVACPRSKLEEVLRRMEDAVSN